MKSTTVILYLLITLLFHTQIAAQITIDGTITDSELNPIGNALVEFIDEHDTTNVYNTNTNELGYYNITGITDIRTTKTFVPKDFIPLRNYPNPFNPSTIIHFEIPTAENIEIKIYDILGKEVRTLINNFHKAGIYQINWDGRNDLGSGVTAGIYLCRLITKRNSYVHKMILLDGSGSRSYSGNSSLVTSCLQKMQAEVELHKFTMRISADSFATYKIDNLFCTKDTTINVIVYRPQSDIIGTSGGIIETDGFVLNIPQGALLEDTEITLTPFIGSSMNEWCISAVSLMPIGLVFEEPVTLSVPLPLEWQEDHFPLVIVSYSDNPLEFFDTGVCTDISTSLGKLSPQNNATAKTSIRRAGKYGFVENCHKGTVAFLSGNFEERGCNHDTAWQKINDKYPNLNANFSKEKIYPKAMEAFLGTYFKETAKFSYGMPVSPSWAEIEDYVRNQDRRVVVLFANNTFGIKDLDGFYNRIAHSATLEMKNGKLKMRHSLDKSKTNGKVIEALIKKNGANVMWYPEGDNELTAENLDIFRMMKSVEALQKELSNHSDLFSDLLPISEREIQPWTAINFYVANQSDKTNPCIESAIGSWEGIIDISWGWSILKINTDKWIVDTPNDGSFEFPVSHWNAEAQFAILYGYDDGVAKGKPYKKFAWEFITEDDDLAINLYFYQPKATLEDAILATEVWQQSYLQWVGD